jgi:branched-chain amino acid aminotransferase
MLYYHLNGKFYTEAENNISVNNRSFRYGDGFFETIKVLNNSICLRDLHFERIIKSLDILQFELPKHFSFTKLEEQIIELAKKNNHHQLGRIRLTFFRNDGGLYDAISLHPNILIQSFALNESVNTLNENGLVIDVYPTAQKSCDIFSNIKSNNYLQYAMAALWAKEKKVNDALLLNCNNNIADSTIANVFLIKDGIIKTPHLCNGCVDGVMRTHIINSLQQHKINIIETEITIDDLLAADEVFLTNAIKGINWVRCFRDKMYSNFQTQKIYKIINEAHS